MTYSKLIGARVKRKEDPRLITGAAAYTGDIQLPGMRYVMLVRSPYAHARIRGIDTSTALKRPGVRAVITGPELLAFCDPMPLSGPGEGGADDDAEQKSRRYLLAVDRVRHVGEAVAAVIADSPAVAADAVADVLVDWEPLPAVINPEKALAPDAPRVSDDQPGNIAEVWSRKHGDPEAAFASAFRVVRQRMVNQRLAGVPMEGRAVVAAPDLATGGLTMWTSTQTPHDVRRDVAARLRLPETAVRVIAPEVGGGFGLKGGVYPEEILVAALARQYRLPLQWVETRMEHMTATTHGRGQVADLEAAVQADGTVTALRVRLLADMGAYPLAPFIPMLTGLMAVGAYCIPNVDVEVTSVLTHTTPIGAYRGAGRPEAAYYIERVMDLVAAELNLDPVEVRRRNFIPPEAFPYESPTGMEYDSGEYDRALTKVLENANYPALREEQRRRRTRHDDRLLGIGVASYVELGGPGPYESALVRVGADGAVTVQTGISPHGQGQETTFAQIVADRLGVDFDHIIVQHGDTATAPMGVGTYGSRGLAIGGSALVRAVEKVSDKARRVAAHMLEAAPEDVVHSEGRYHVKGVPDRGLTLKQIAERAYSDDLPDDLDSGLEASDFFRPSGTLFPFGAHVAVVEVERETGVVHLRSYFTVDDCGPRISPLLVEGQVHGGLAQGIAQALLEEVVYDDNGQLLTGSLTEYALPRADLFPMFVTDQTETPTPHNPLGAKGIGEAATTGSTPAIVNAVMDALKPFGVRHIDMPLRPEKIWRAMLSAASLRQAQGAA
jgi:carbon-monoxide dehydrogenase large subunit